MRNNPVITSLALLSLLGMAACAEMEPPPAPATPPDMQIKVEKTPDGHYVAVPPECPDWRMVGEGAFDNNPWPQFGCANQRNLALMARPQDLIQGRQPGPANGTVAAAAVNRYESGSTKTLVDPNAAAPVASQTAAPTLGVTGGAAAASP